MEKEFQPYTSLQSQISSMLQELGVRASIIGHRYLLQAIEIVYYDDQYLRCITKMLYPEVAKYYKTTPGAVERAMRHAIQTAWERTDAEFFNDVFHNRKKEYKKKPTNSEFIALVVENLRFIHSDHKDVRFIL